MLAEVALEGQAWHFRSPGPRLSGGVRRGGAGRVAAIPSPEEFLDDCRISSQGSATMPRAR